MKIKTSTLRWIWNDLVHPNFRSFLSITLLDVLGVLCQVGAYGLLLRYVSALEQTSELNILGYTYTPQSSQAMLIVVAIGTGVLFLFYGLMEYGSRIKVIQITRDYEAYCSKRVIQALSTVNQKLGFKESEKLNFDYRRLRKSLIKDARFCGRLSGVFSFSIVTVIKFVGSLIFMFSINSLLTLLILLMAIPIVFVLKHFAKLVVSLTQTREIRLPGFINSQKYLMQASLNPSETNASHDTNSDPLKEVSDFYKIYHGISKKLAQSDLIIAVFIALLSIVIILVAGNLVLFGDMSWTVFIAFIIALRYFFGSLKSLNGLLKKSSKIYDYVNHYVNTLEQIHTGEGVPALAAYEKVQLTSSKKPSGLGLDLDSNDDDDDDDDF